jgi:N-acetylglucosamine kinase-like BadF-type ATPase
MNKSQIFLGVDGGQSHTEAVIADQQGNILGRGTGGASNHAEQPGGRERLRNAVTEAVGGALRDSKLGFELSDRFAAAHFGMTGGADYKQEIIGSLIDAAHLKVGHDAPTALCGATAARTGIVVIAGTGSVVYGENEAGDAAQIGGLGFLFSDEGSGFWLAVQTIRFAIKEQDGLIERSGLEEMVLEFFGVGKIRDLTTAFYNEKISREEIAALAKVAAQAAADGSRILREQIRLGAWVLANSVRSAEERLKLTDGFPVAGIGGMFRGALLKKYFAEFLDEKVPRAQFAEPVFGPAIGALLLAYREANVEITGRLIANLENSQKR